ncbi:hypothetical protein BAE44_0009349 [Dichanthelium oligosanthes]|uniref:Disease resistance R13L4/SHOC-2-like LRR domain-containing protein n=1 Tax=Dichanthelium oligosanthes TaxID=888268 RepID=A0A1E5VWX7_9POAL|nr:hypothetical protein BAE44_0009349 [Dichanthelium oligosanthes]
MCLHLDWDTKLSNGLSNLTSLQELTGLRVGHDSADVVRELGHHTGLRVLTMRWEETDLGEDLVLSLGKLHKIQSLDVYVNGVRGDVMRSWVPPPGLRRFLSKGPTSHLSTLPAWTLGTLPSLRSLRLRATGRIEDRGTERHVVRAGAFPCARACALLHFVTAPSMFPRGALPVAQRLEFSVLAWDFARGGGLGLDGLRMEHLPSLEEIYVELSYRRSIGDVVEVVAAALRRAADGHPNHPTLRINRRIRCVSSLA